MSKNPLAAIPSIELLLQRDDMRVLIQGHGHQRVRDGLRQASQALRAAIAKRGEPALPGNVADSLAQATASALIQTSQPSMRPVFNLTGTILHTNLGRAVLPLQAVQALSDAARYPTNVEFDLVTGKRGDRDDHVEALLRQITGAQAATVVNNNAAAVLLSLNTVALGMEVVVSRGELVEIGGSFRMPDIMASAGCVLTEVGTTNRTHLSDYENALGPNTAALMTVDPSNYVIEGFTKQLNKSDIVAIAHKHGLPLIDDLGSGSLVNLPDYGLPAETTVQQALGAGADLVTFSGDKLLGGPQLGVIAGRKDLIERIKRNPMKRALRVDKLRLAALQAVLQLYLSPEKLPERLPTLRLLTRPLSDINATAQRVCQVMRKSIGAMADIEVVDCMSQIGSGSLPVDLLPSRAIAVTPGDAGPTIKDWSSALRSLPRPVISRIHQNQLRLDVRTLQTEEEDAFTVQLAGLRQQLAHR